MCWLRVNQQRVDGGSIKCVVKWVTDNAEQWLLRPRESTADSEAAFARKFRDKLEHISQPGPSGTESKVCSQNTVVFTSPSENTKQTNTCFILTHTKTDKCANVSIPVLNSHTSESSSCSTSSGLMGAATGQAGPAGTYQMEPINPSSYQHGKTLVWYCHPKPCLNSILYQHKKFYDIFAPG